jgi:hypothetical protein
VHHLDIRHDGSHSWLLSYFAVKDFSMHWLTAPTLQSWSDGRKESSGYAAKYFASATQKVTKTI